VKPLIRAENDWNAQNNRAIEQNFRQLEEGLRAGYQPLDDTLTELAANNWVANALPIGDGADSMSQVTFAANTFPARASAGNLAAKTITDFGLSLVDDANAGAARTTLGLGTMATQDAADYVTLASAQTVSGAKVFSALTAIGAGPADRQLQVNGFARFTDGTIQFEIVNGGGVGYVGTNNNYPVAVQVNAAEVARFTSTGLAVTGAVSATTSITSSGAASGIGYATGAGGTVTQATSKATDVTLNKACGEITMNNAALAAGATVFFTLTNSAIAATDLLVLNHVGAGSRASYTLDAECAAGSATIYVRNNTAGSLSEAIVIRFALVKGVTA